MTNITMFGNNGEFDPRAFKTFGLHAKMTNDSIGLFGTGLKYAIAILIRLDRKIWIEANGEKYEFSHSLSTFRGKEFKEIHCNGEALPFTTELGKKWELWQAYRELASNAMDEGGGVDFDGGVKIYAELKDIPYDSVFMPDKPLLSAKSNFCEIYEGKSNFIYRKGIRAEKQVTGYTYNVLKEDLTEDRTFKYDQAKKYAICSAWAQCTDPSMIDWILYRCKETYEGEELNFEYCWIYKEHSFSPELQAAALKAQRSGKWRNKSLVNAIYKKTRKIEKLTHVEPTTEQAALISKAKAFLIRADYNIEQPIYVSENMGDNVLGTAENNSIYLAPEIFRMGYRWVVKAMLEEFIHLEHDVWDNTREMQDVLFEEVVRHASVRFDEFM